MADKRTMTKALAAIGTLLVVTPLLAPLFFAFAHFVTSHEVLIDYLMPMELSLAALLGAGLLIAAALLARSNRRIISWTSAAAFACLLGGIAAAELTGLSSGEYDPTGWRLMIVAALLAGYVAATLALGIEGALLTARVLKRSAAQKTAEKPIPEERK